MAAIFFLDSIRRSLLERARKKRIAQAATWPQAVGTINSWEIQPLGDEAESFTQSDCIEAGFAFTLNGEYYGGYVRSVGMSRREAETLATGDPTVSVRYNPTDPDEVATLAEDNPTLSFTIVSG